MIVAKQNEPPNIKYQILYIDLHNVHLVPDNESSLGLSLASFNILDKRGKV